jgi:hypothetical protein
MRRIVTALAVLLSIFFGFSSNALLFGQHAVDPTQGFHRLICLVHMTGKGTNDDPKRPEYVPGTAPDPSRSGILAWSQQVADDGKMAIVHLVAADRNAFAAILADKRPEMRVFEIGKDKREDIEKELRKFKKDFDLDTLKVVAR